MDARWVIDGLLVLVTVVALVDTLQDAGVLRGRPVFNRFMVALLGLGRRR